MLPTRFQEARKPCGQVANRSRAFSGSPQILNPRCDIAMDAELKSRRRPITYGKSLRRAPLQFQSSSPASSPPKKPFQAISHDDESPAWCGSDGSASGSKSPQTPLSNLITSVARTSTSAKSPKLQYAISPEAIFDVPSSDEERHVCGTGIHQAYHKRRKVTSPRKSLGSTPAWDSPNLRATVDAQAQQSRLNATTHAGQISDHAAIVPPEDPILGVDMPQASSRITTAREASETTLEQVPRTQNHHAQRDLPTDKASKVDSRPNPQSERMHLEPTKRPVMRVGKAKPRKISPPRKHLPLSTKSRETVQETSKNEAIRTHSTLAYVSQARAVTPDAYSPQPADLCSPFSPGTIGLNDLQISAIGESAFNEATDSALTSYQRTRSPNPQGRRKLKDRLHNSNRNVEEVSSGRGSPVSVEDAEHEPSPSGSDSLREDRPSELSSASSSQPNESLPNSTGANGPRLGGTDYGAPKVTYARQRSYLTEDDVASGALPNASSQESFDASQTARASQGFKNSLVATTALHDVVDDNDSGTLKTIHELRESGGNVRQMGEAEAILEDIDSRDMDSRNPTSLSIRRRALLDLAIKLQTPSFGRRFMENGLDDRLFAQTDMDLDAISTILLMCSLMPVLAITCEHAHTPSTPSLKIFQFLLLQLERGDELEDLVKSRKANIARALQKDLQGFCSSLRQSSAWGSGRPSRLSSQVIALQCLEYLLKSCQHRPLDVTAGNIDQISTLLQSPSGDDPATAPANALTNRITLSCLELATLASIRSSRQQESAWTSVSVEKLVQFLSSRNCWSGDGSGATTTSALRLCLNLTNHNQALCSLMSKAEVIHAALAITESHFHEISQIDSTEEGDLLLDNLVLSLGLMINIAEGSVAGLQLFLNAGGPSRMPLEALLDLYLGRWQTSSEVISRSAFHLSQY